MLTMCKPRHHCFKGLNAQLCCLRRKNFQAQESFWVLDQLGWDWSAIL